MSSRRVFWIMASALAVSFILLIGAVVLGDRLLRSRGADLTALKLEGRVMESQQTSLSQANKDIQKYAELEQIAKSIVPQDKDQAKTVREIVKLAQENRIPLSSVNFPSSTLGQAAPKTTSTGTTPTTTAAPSITQVKPVEGIQGVYQMEITIQSDTKSPVPYSSLINFLSSLERNRRTAQVSTISVKPDGRDVRLVSFNLVVNVYIKP